MGVLKDLGKAWDGAVDWGGDQWNDWGRDLFGELMTPFAPFYTLGRLGYDYLAGLMQFQVPEPDQASASYGYGYPVTVDAQGRPRQLVLGRPLAAALRLYESRDLDATDYLLGWGAGPLAFVPHPSVNGVPVDDLSEAWATNYPGSGDQPADARSAHVRHLEPSGAAVSLEVWDLDSDGAEPAPGSLTAETTFTVDNANARVRVHLRAGLSGDGAKTLRCSLYHKLSSSGTWIDDGTYTLSIPKRVSGTVAGYIVIGGGDATTSAPAGHDFDPDTLTLEFSKEPGYRTLLQTAEALAFAAGTYDLRLAFEDQATGPGPGRTRRGTLELHAVEVEEVNDAYAMRWLAYSAVTLATTSSGGSQTFAGRPAGLPCKVWDAEGATWRSEWSNNPVWLAADVAARADGLGRGAAGVDWDRLQAEAAHCDGVVATLEAGLTVSAGPYLGLQCATRNGDRIPAGDTLALCRNGGLWPTTATLIGAHGGLLVLDVSGAYTPTTGDQWCRLGVPWQHYTVLAAVGPVYALAGMTAADRDYGGFLLEDDTSGEVRRLLHWDTAPPPGGAWAVLQRDFTSAPAGSVSVQAQRYRADLVLDTQQDAGEACRAVLACAAGDWYDTAAGLWACAVGRPRSPVYVLKPSAMVAGSFVPGRIDPADARDHLVVTYRDQWNAGEEGSVPLGAPVGRVDHTLKLDGVVWEDQAARLGYIDYNRPRVCVYTASVTATHHAAELEPWDVIRVKHPRMGWGYDLSDIHAPVELADDHASVPLMVVLSIQEGADGRTLELAQWSDAIFSDTPGILGAPDPAVVAPDPFAPPDAPEALVLTYLGDLTPDGIHNPEVQLEWIHPAAQLVAAWDVYQSFDGGTNWERVTSAGRLQPVRWRVLGFTGSLLATVQPVGIGGQRTKWASLPTAAATISADTTAPATPADLVASFATAAAWTWTPNSESDLSHYELSLDAGATWWRSGATRYEIPAPTARSYTLQVRAVDRTGNASDAAEVTASLPAPSAPSTATLLRTVYANSCQVWVDSAAAESAGHVGWAFEWRLAGGSWVRLVGSVATLTVPVADFAGTTQGIEIRYAEVDGLGVGAFSDAVSETLTAPTYDDLVSVPPQAASLWVPAGGELFAFVDHVTGSKGSAPV